MAPNQLHTTDFHAQNQRQDTDPDFKAAVRGRWQSIFFFKGRGPATERTSGYPLPDSRDRHQQPSSEFETTKATISKYSFLLITVCPVVGDN
jgi:hypothetical protein